MTDLRRVSRTLTAGILALALCLTAGPLPAFALLDDPLVPAGSSPTNPNTGPDGWWRMGWGNNPYPVFVLNVPGVDAPEEVIGMLYTVDRSASTLIDSSTPDDYYRSARPTGTNLTQAIDLPGTVSYPPFDTMPLVPGATSPIEGMWYLHWKFFTNLGNYRSLTDFAQVGIDVTPPDAVTGLAAAPYLGGPTDPDAWVASQRAHLTWDEGPYDALSGDAYYQVYLNDQPIIPEDAASAGQGRVFVLPGGELPDSITIEDMPPGRQKLSVAVVDRATNAGPLTSTYFNSDPDVPTIGLSVPPITGRYAQMIASPSDLGGVAKVDFFVDGMVTPVGTVTSAPYALTVDMTPYGTGTHSFHARVTDMLGRTAWATAGGSIDPTTGFRAGVWARLGTFTYPDEAGLSPVRYFSSRSVPMSLASSTTLDGFAYTLSRASDTLPSIPSAAGDPPTRLLSGATPEIAPGTEVSAGELDLASWQAVQTSPPESTTGVTDPIEGAWYMTAKGLLTSQFPPLSGNYRRVKFMVDVTGPRAVTGLATVGGPASGSYQDTTRADILWNNPAAAGFAQYDVLSGDSYYAISVNGVEIAQQKPILSLPYNMYGVENLPAGTNTIGVSVVDVAGNRSTETTVEVLVDTGVPTIDLSATPYSSGIARLNATVSDDAGVDGVSFYAEDGAGDLIPLGDVLDAPYTLDADLSTYPDGLATVVWAVVVDKFGHTAWASAVASEWTGGFQAGVSAALGGYTYPDEAGLSPVRYFASRTIPMSLVSNTTLDGFAYTLSRASDTLPYIFSAAGDPPTRLLSGATPEIAPGTEVSAGELDLASWQAVQTSPPESTTGVTDPIEGAWYMTAKGLLSSEVPPLSSDYRRVKFMVDVTAPRSVTGLQLLGGPPATPYLGSARADVVWNNPAAAGLAQYDVLSGDAYYAISVNGVEVAQQKPILSLPYNMYGVENLPAGANTIGVSVVDNAGNRGSETVLRLLVDPDVPTIVNTTADHVGRYAALTSTPSDSAGVSRVSYYVNGSYVGAATSAPWTVVADMNPFGMGYHTVQAVVTDMAGRTASDSKTTHIANLSVPTLSRISGAPKPFFPIKRDRYKDNLTIKYRLGERAYVTLNIYDASGNVIRTMAGWRNAGSRSFVWNGKRADGTVVAGNYTYRLVADDGAYNVAVSAPYSAQIRAYILKRISRNKVKVIYH